MSDQTRTSIESWVHAILLTCLSCSPAWLHAQKLTPPPVPQAPHAPWIDLMLAPDPDVRAVDQAYEAWYAVHPFEKTTYTQYHKKWRREVETWLDGSGHVRYPGTEELRHGWESAKNRRSQVVSVPGRAKANWIPLGPFETISDAVGGDQEAVSWQANVYSLDQSVSDPDVLICGTEGAEIYRTHDRGLHWSPVSRDLDLRAVLAVAIDPTDAGRFFAGDNDRVMATDNDGADWGTLLTVSQLGVNDIAIHPNRPDTLLVAAAKGLWRSPDGGLTWDQLFPEKCFDLEFKPGDPSVVYLLKDDPADKRCTFWRSTDGGTTFQPMPGNGWFNGTDPDRMDGGGRLTVTPADPDRIYAVLIGQAKDGDNGFIGVYSSQDGGNSWILPNPPAGGPYSQDHPNLAVISPFDGTGFHQGYYNLSIAASHTNADDLLVGHLSLWRSGNGGATFSRIGGYGGSLSWVHPDVQEARCLGGDTWVCTDGGINYSSNFFSTHESRKEGITGSDYWGFGQGWNEDVLVGGRYHNGNSGWVETYPFGHHLRLGGGEAPTGYVSPAGGRKAWFSDIGGKILPATIDQPSVGFSVTKSPNELYYPGESSDQVWDPSCSLCYLMGRDNQLWRTEDGGISFDLVASFDQTDGGRVTQIAQCLGKPGVIYVAQRNSATWSEGWVWKTSDGGQSWTSLSLPAGYKRRMLLTVSGTDPDAVWLGYTDGANGEKVFESFDGGGYWTNITSPLMDGESPATLVHILGTDGSLVLGTNKTVYFRSGPGEDWAWFGDGLPTAISCNLLRPFYRDGKLRLGAYGKGLWETPLPVIPDVVCQPMADKRIAWCIRDTFQFDDHSVLRHEGASWAWSFPGGQPSTSTLRAPRVVYPEDGVYPVELVVTDASGQSSTGTMSVGVRNECSPDTVPGYALHTQADGDAAVMPTLAEDVHEELTISAWVKPSGGQASYAGIVVGAYQDAAFGINVRDNNVLGYHWPGGAWWWNSGFTLVADEWQHVAVVMKTGSVTVYLNGVGNTHVTDAQPVSLDGVSIGRYRDWNSRTWKGMIDEVAIWDRALTREEIRETMHLTKRLAEEPDLIAYYQFNRESGQETDRVGVRHLQFAGGATRVRANGPWGGGVSRRLLVDTEGTADFGNTGIRMTFPENATYPDGEIVVSRIHLAPDTPADPDHPGSPHYWVVNNYGNLLFDPVSLLDMDRVGPVDVGNVQNPSTMSLYVRPWNAEGETWSLLANAVSAEAGPDGRAAFGAIQDMGQWSVVNTTDVTDVQEPTLPTSGSDQLVAFSPNPVRSGKMVRLVTSLGMNVEVQIWDLNGREIWHGETSSGQPWLVPTSWAPGVYTVQVRSSTCMACGKLVVVEGDR